MPSGRGLQRAVPQIAPWANLFALPAWTADTADHGLAADWYFAGRGPVTPVPFPWAWFNGPLRFRQDSPLNQAAVTKASGATVYAEDSTSIDTYGQWSFVASLLTDSAQDARNLASQIVTYYTDPRVRCPQLNLTLNRRSQTECWTILEREVGDVITLTGVPPGWPEGANTFVIEGIAHYSTSEIRSVTWAAAPVIGTSPDVTGPWFRLGVSALGGTDVLPY